MSIRRPALVLAAACALCIGWKCGITAAPQNNQTPETLERHVNQDRLWNTLLKLGEFGKNPEGGVSRVGFSEADLAGRAYVMDLMRQAGLAVRTDPAGNIFGSRLGSQKLPVLLFGSHIDSVPHGGDFDGDVGSLSAIEVIRALNEAHLTTRHPLEVLVWSDEEGGRYYSGLFGSSAAAGLLPSGVGERVDEHGTKLSDWLTRMGGDATHLADAKIVPGSVSGYLELHIEQGANLDEAKIPIGVVTGIVGISERTCTATGFANHAGTTPMNHRRDALAAASRAVLAVRDEVRGEPGRQVGTIGWMKVEPGANNVIPGRVTFPVELRDLDADKVRRLGDQIMKRFHEIGREENVDIACTLDDFAAPALTDKSFQAAIRSAAHEAGLATLDLPSGAGHDAQNAARFAPVGMIFVPSRNGISHSPFEYTSPEQVANGAEVLYRSVLKLDAQLDRSAPHPQ
ncbi:MAG TPA: Zn-dependent hydrolase [Candidatus Acidoferrum sp.]|nr:Zn-dependent hydrolase [Candidatus Acidoferrum sp.]